MKTKLRLLQTLLVLFAGSSWAQPITVTVVDGKNAPYDYYGTRNNSATPNTFTSNATSGLAGVVFTAPVIDRHSNWWDVYSMVVKTSAVQTDESLTITAPAGYLIEGYSIDFVSQPSGCSYDVTLPGQSTTEISNAASTVLTASNLNVPSSTITIKAKGSTVNWLCLKSFTINVIKSQINVAINVTGSTEAENTRAGKITMTLSSGTSSIYLDGSDDEAQTIDGYVPETFTASSTSYRGYEFTGFSVGGTNFGTSIAAGDFASVPHGSTITANYTATTGNGIVLWDDYSDDSSAAYRLPAIVRTQSGRLIAFADYRPGKKDVGEASTSIETRYSDDDGETWSGPLTAAKGNWSESARNYMEWSFGDAAVVADNTAGNSGNNILMVCSAGNRKYGVSTYDADNQVAQLGIALLRSTDGGATWSDYTNITPDIMAKLEGCGLRAADGSSGIVRAFFSSGKITQSVRKADGAAYNRIYSALVTNSGNVVVYSDDFGDTWEVLGGQVANNGDEAHVVELPDGDLLLVGKGNSSRYVNVFNYSDFDTAAGTWGAKGQWNNATATSCHGDAEALELYDLNGNKHTVVLQTAPMYTGQRRDIQYYYIALPKSTGFSVSDFSTKGGASWTQGMNVTHNWSAYSSIVGTGSGTFDMLFEECATGETQSPSGYNIVYQKGHTAQDITGDKFFASLLDLTGVGYPTEEATERTSLANVLSDPDATDSEISDAVTAFKACTNVEMPQDGQYYTLTMVSKTGTTFWPLIADGTTLSCGTSGSTPTTFYCHQFTNKNGDTRFAFIDENGRILGYKHLTDDYKVAYLENDFQVGAMISSTESNISGDAVRFGRVYITSDNRSSDTNPYCYIIKESDQAFNSSKTPFLNGTYTSAISMRTGTPFASTAARDLAVAKIDAIALHYTHIGTDYGLYNRSASPFADAAAYKTAIDACTTPGEVAAIRDAIEVNQPRDKFVRFYSPKQSKYMGVGATGKHPLVASQSDAGIYYVTPDNHIISYKYGQYLANDAGAPHTAIGNTGGEFSFTASDESMKYFIYCGGYLVAWDSNGQYYTDRLSSYENKVDYARWTIEAVESLPVGITSIDGRGFASFYTPVDIASLPSGVKAYIATLTSTRVLFTEITSIPAGTAVVLYMPTCAESTEVSLPIGTASASTDGNVLRGAAAAAALGEQEEVLTMQNGANGVGFYKYNGENLAGFKAYINVSDIPSGIKGFAFDFEDAADGIEAIHKDETTIHKDVYDLQGRKLNGQRSAVNGQWQKGIYIEKQASMNANVKKILK